MGSTATSKAVKKTSVKAKKDSGDKKSVGKAAPKKAKSRATPVKKKAVVRKKAAAPKKATSKKTAASKAAVKKKAPRKKAGTRVGTKSAQSQDQLADVTAVAGTTAGPTDATATDAAQGDPKSLSWMAAQAASALKAVRANQNERAQELLAKAEITPATPVKVPQKDKTQTAPDAPESKQEAKQNTQADKTPIPVKTEAKKSAKSARSETKPETKKDKKTDTAPKPDKAMAKQVKKASPAVVPAEQTAPDKTLSAPSAPVAPEPVKQGTVQAAESRAAPAQSEDTENTITDKPDIPPAHVIAATSKAPGKRRSKRLILLTGIIVLAGVLGARVWFSHNDTADIAVVQDSAETEQVSSVTAKPPITKPLTEVISSVDSEPPAKPATAAAQTNSGAPATHPAWPEPASTPETLPTATATAPETTADEVVATEPPQQQETTQTTATTAQVTSPAAPQPAYYAPAYGYYPQQPVRQQSYYRQGYPR